MPIETCCLTSTEDADRVQAYGQNRLGETSQMPVTAPIPSSESNRTVGAELTERAGNTRSEPHGQERASREESTV